MFTKNRDRLLNQDIARSFFRRVVERAADLMSDEHFTVDGTLIEAWASQKSFQRKDGGTDGDGSNFRGQERKNDTHASTTDPDARLYRKSNGAESRLAYWATSAIENRHGLIADAMATLADGTAEREARLLMLHAQWQQDPGSAAPWGPTRRTTSANLSTWRATSIRRRMSRRMWHDAAAVPLTRAPHATPGLRDESACAPAHRTGVRVVENDCLDTQGQTARRGQCRLAVRVRQRRINLIRLPKLLARPA